MSKSHKSFQTYEKFICVYHNKDKFMAHIILYMQMTEVKIIGIQIDVMCADPI